MWLKNACVIKKIPINNAAAAGSDPDVAGFIEKATQMPVNNLSYDKKHSKIYIIKEGCLKYSIKTE
jgi:hypothetical protein